MISEKQCCKLYVDSSIEIGKIFKWDTMSSIVYHIIIKFHFIDMILILKNDYIVSTLKDNKSFQEIPIKLGNKIS